MANQYEDLNALKAEYEEKARCLHSYVKELTEMSAKHGTDASLLEEDMSKARSDVEFYETEAKLIAEELGKAASHSTYWVFQDASGEWRWQLRAGNNRIIADSGEGYHNRQDCLHGIELVKDSKHSPVKDKE
jgi:uncharacterized protein YegP (UPF0339 family)